MVKIKKKDNVAVFKSGTGANIKLDILINNVLKITVFTSFYTATRRKIIILIIFILCTSVSVVLHLFNTKVITSFFVIILLMTYRLCGVVKEECLVVIKGLGFQMTTKYIFGIKTTFIPQEQVQNILINEIIYRNKVIYILSLLSKDTSKQEKLIPLFFDTLPRLACLKVIYNHIKTIQD